MVARAHLVWSSKVEAKPTTNTGILRSRSNTMATEDTAVEPPMRLCNRALDGVKFSSTIGDECVMPQNMHYTPLTSFIHDSPWFAIGSETYEGMLPSTVLQSSPYLSPLSPGTGTWQAGSPGLSYLSDIPSSLSFDAPSPDPCSGSFSPIVSHHGDSHEFSQLTPQPRLGSHLAAGSLPGLEATAPVPLTQSSYQAMKVPAVNVCDEDVMHAANSSTAAAVTNSSSEQEGQQLAEAVIADSYNVDDSVPRSLDEQMQSRISKRAPQAVGQLSASSGEEIDSRGSSNVMDVMNRFCRDSETEIAQSTDLVEPVRKKGQTVYDGKKKTGTGRMQLKKSAKEHEGTAQEIPQEKQGLRLTRKRKSMMKRIALTGLEGHGQKKRRLLPTFTETNREIENASSSSFSEVVTGKSDEELTLNQVQELSTHQPMPHCSDEEFPVHCRDHCRPSVVRAAMVDGSDKAGALRDIAIQDQLSAMRLQDSTSFATAAGQGTGTAAASESLSLQARDPSGGLGAGGRHHLNECGGGAVERASDADRLVPRDGDSVDHVSLGNVGQMVQRDRDSSLSAPPTGRWGCSYAINDSQRLYPGEKGFRKPSALAQPQFPFSLMAASSRFLANYWSSDCSAAEHILEGSSAQDDVDGERPGLTSSQQRSETLPQETCAVKTACGGILHPREGAAMNDPRESGAVSPLSPRSCLTTLRNTVACDIPVIAKNPQVHPADMLVQNIGEWLQKASISTDGGLSKPPGLLTDVLPLARLYTFHIYATCTLHTYVALCECSASCD
ncbi:hypothetical protein CBR_g46628 [Chara braunii]|uniref:Uncharacterized protein n=1 Tax=Chara braunii TaxID=69332 RepID=A0A388M0P2_CHABU|nr:hypothetical protein CBR_g46628 [Chara braunii]|eukprot:GBG88140.1 hypothetical protein CBR_g46628 [Chara braunii]